MCVLVGVAAGDSEKDVNLVQKTIGWHFCDEEASQSLLLDVKAKLLLVSQFTLLADTKGKCEFYGAGAIRCAERLFNEFVNVKSSV